MQFESLHLFMPLFILFGYLPLDFATAALVKWLLMFGWCLKANNGGLWKTSARYLFFFVIERQCLICKLEMDGNLGLYGVANTVRLFSFLCVTFWSNFSLGILLALSKAGIIFSCLYPLFSKRSCTSCNLLSLILLMTLVWQELFALGGSH